MDNFELLKRIREQQLTQRELAEKAGLSKSFISEVVRGRRNPTDEQQKQIAEALKTSVKSLFSNN